MGALMTTSTNVFRFIFFLIFFLQIMQTFHFLVASPVLRSHMERRLVDGSGFINIDCGLGAGYSFYHVPNSQTYISDENYISTGKNFVLSSIYDSTWKVLMTVRSFPEGSRNCYNLSPVKPNDKYLIRTRFMYGNYDGLNRVPQFDLYIDVNLWLTVMLQDAGQRLIKEIIHVATAESIHVCLVNTGQGTPFISAIELRPLDNTSYLAASHDISLTLWDREDIGAIENGNGRYSVTDDAYDRLWLKSPTWPDWKLINSTNNGTVDASQDNPSKVPPSVLMTAGETNNGFVNLTNQYTEYFPTSQVCAYWYFAELEVLESNQTREFNISVPNGPGYKFGPISPKYLQLTTIASPIMSLSGSRDFEFTFMKTDRSNLDPILNAVEIYMVLEQPASPTNHGDVDAVIAIKNTSAVLKIWQGDPCLPVNYQWDGLNCTYDANNPPRITSLSLSSRNLTGEIPPSLSKLTSLNYLDLSNNGFTGKIPEFLAYMPSLKVIDLTANDLMGPVPPQLAEKARNKSIGLRVEGNPDVCKSYHCEEDRKKHHFIIPLIIACVASALLLVIIGIIFLTFKRRKKSGSVDQVIKPKNKRFNYPDIVRITDSFRKVLGKGGFGTVYYGVLRDGTEVAVKILNNTSSTITVKQFCAEAELLTRIHHVNLVTLIGYCDEHANLALVYEYMSCGNLQTQLSERNDHPLSWKARVQISVDAAQGLEYLHSGCRPPIIHRDVKPANILLDGKGHAKISDFGLSRFFITNSEGADVSTDLAGTRGYLDPEYYCQINRLSEKSDVYAFGVVLLQLLTGGPALIKDTSDKNDPILPIVDWVSPMVETGDILAIVDKRLQGELIANSAWKFLEIAMECVKPTGNERPRMSEVVADLKACYASVKEDAPVGADKGNYDSMSSSQQAFDSSVVSLPSAR